MVSEDLEVSVEARQPELSSAGFSPLNVLSFGGFFGNVFVVVFLSHLLPVIWHK